MPKTEYITIADITAKLIRAENAVSTVLAVHGFLGSKESRTVNTFAQRASAQGYNVLAIDLPYHGDRQGGELSVERCVADIMTAERYIRENLTPSVSAFGVSFGAFCLLRRAELYQDNYEKLMLVVPAVNMAQSLINISLIFDSTFTPERAKTVGFTFPANSLRLPYDFYEEAVRLCEVRSVPAWNSGKVLAVFAEKDELVDIADAKRFLMLNPQVKAVFVENCGHRVSMDEEHLKTAIDAADEFLLGKR